MLGHEFPHILRNSTAKATGIFNNNPGFQQNLINEEPPTIHLKLLSTNEPFSLRTLLLPANIGRVSDSRTRPSARNGLFNSRFLSRHHAVIKWEGERVVVEDLGSCNGTFVNGVAVKSGENWPLAEGDILQFGSDDDNAESKCVF